mmetsp:Transcript_125806/g.363958  ORF Transcript_125806/g.363958 Transcript_125806/m.363958 type:complete len:435 (-) Transcript_125806:374-1678(-)
MNAAEDQVRAAAEDSQQQASEEGAAGDAQEGPSAEGEREAQRVQKLADGILIGIAYSASAGGIATITGAIPNYILAAETMVKDYITWGNWFLFAAPISIVTGLLAYTVLYVRYVRRLSFSGISRQVLEQEYEELISEVGPLSRDEIIVGALQVLQVVLLIIRGFSFSKWFVTPAGEELVNDATLALVPAILLFIIPSQVRPGQALLTWPVVHEKFDFGLLLLIGGSIAINYGFTNSGLSVALGEAVGSLIPRVHPFTLNLVVVLSVTMCSQVLSSISTASTMLPVLAAASVDAMVNPLTLMLPATIATSFAFLLPTATPPNVVVLAKSQELGRSLRFRDFFTNGLVLMFVCVVVGAALSAGMARLVFVDDDTLPQWACEALPARCLWVNVEGIVRGVAVSSQACIVDLATSGETCRLWNGDLVLTSMTMGVPEM